MMINNYVAYYQGSTHKLQRDTARDRNDFDIIRDNHRFLWSPGELTEADQNWEARLAKRYYEKLFKEYCIVDLSQYKRNVYAMRWRTEKELFAGKGQFVCGNKHCQSGEGLSSWEVNFGYEEHGVRKSALVKVRLCPDCSDKLNFHSRKRLVKKAKKEVVKLELGKVKKEEAEEALEEKKHRKRKGKKKRRGEEETEEERTNRKEKKRRRRKRRDSSTSSSSSSASSSSSSTPGKEAGDGEGEQKVTSEEKRKIDQQAKAAAQSASEIWAGKTAVLDAERAVTDEFDEFIDDLLL